jgi:hypothetical protein
VVNAGILFPLTEDRRLQALLEYNTVVKKNIPSVYERNHRAIMPGLRFVTEDWNVSLGVQLYKPSDPPETKDTRYLGTLSYAF